jgi:hypothetical protein
MKYVTLSNFVIAPVKVLISSMYFITSLSLKSEKKFIFFQKELLISVSEECPSLRLEM